MIGQRPGILWKNGESMASGLIAGEDEEFGSVVEVPLKHEDQVKEALNIDAERINHLSAEHQEQLLTSLNKYQESTFTSSLK